MDGVKIGGNVEINEGVTLFPNVFIGDDVCIGANSVIQYGAFIEKGCVIGHDSRVGTNAVMRRETHLGNHSIFGSLSASEGKNWIGDHVLVHSQCHLTTGLIIEDWVFIAPMFVGANDPEMVHGRRRDGVFVPQAGRIGFGSRLAIGVHLLPGVRLGRECVIGASSLVTRDVEEFSIAFGSPAKPRGMVVPEERLPAERYEEFLAHGGPNLATETVAKMLKDY